MYTARAGIVLSQGPTMPILLARGIKDVKMGPKTHPGPIPMRMRQPDESMGDTGIKLSRAITIFDRLRQPLLNLRR